MPRPIDEPLHVQRAIAERGRRLASRLVDARRQRAVRRRMVFIPMPPPPADGLRRTGKPTLRADAAMAWFDWSAGVSPGTTGTPAFCAIARAAIFDPSRSITAAGGPMNVMPASAHAAANAGILGQEAVTGVDRVRARLACGVHDRRNRQVAFGRRGRANPDRAIGKAHVQRVGIGIRVYRNGGIASSRQARMTRTAISPRLAIRTCARRPTMPSASRGRHAALPGLPSRRAARRWLPT